VLLHAMFVVPQYQDRLDKTAVGDYLGREREYMDGFCLKVPSFDACGVPCGVVWW
jgi:hypothetical protein